MAFAYLPVLARSERAFLGRPAVVWPGDPRDWGTLVGARQDLETEALAGNPTGIHLSANPAGCPGWKDGATLTAYVVLNPFEPFYDGALASQRLVCYVGSFIDLLPLDIAILSVRVHVGGAQYHHDGELDPEGTVMQIDLGDVLLWGWEQTSSPFFGSGALNGDGSLNLSSSTLYRTIDPRSGLAWTRGGLRDCPIRVRAFNAGYGGALTGTLLYKCDAIRVEVTYTPGGAGWDGRAREIDAGNGDNGGLLTGSLGLDGTITSYRWFCACCMATKLDVLNMALLRIGISKLMPDLTNTQEETVIFNAAYDHELQATLRDFPWPFATKYATLALVDGSDSDPVNTDWTYAYRQPSDCIFPRRIVVARGSAVDPTPPPFRMGFDSDGVLLFTNQADAVLEYTSDMQGVECLGDPLFREAVIWRIAAALAPPLTRMTEKERDCLAMYEGVLITARSVLQLGNPGARAATSAVDTTAAARAANVAVVNRALVRIGARTIANMETEQSREAVAAALVFEEELQAVLRDHPWAFATQYADLELLDGSADTPINGDWIFMYRQPADAVYLRRLVTPARRAYSEQPYNFRLGQGPADSDEDVRVIYTDVEDANMEYTARLDGIVALADAQFREAFAWRLAATLAPSLAQSNPEQVEQRGRGPLARRGPTPGRESPQVNDAPTAPAGLDRALMEARSRIAANAWQMYRYTLDGAATSDINEQQRPPNDDAPWIAGR